MPVRARRVVVAWVELSWHEPRARSHKTHMHDSHQAHAAHTHAHAHAPDAAGVVVNSLLCCVGFSSFVKCGCQSHRRAAPLTCSCEGCLPLHGSSRALSGYLPFLHQRLMIIADAANAAPKGVPLLVSACEHRNLRAMRLLLIFGADVNASNTAGWTALHVAAQQGTSRGCSTVTARPPRHTISQHTNASVATDV